MMAAPMDQRPMAVMAAMIAPMISAVSGPPPKLTNMPLASGVAASADRESVGEGKRVGLGGCRNI